MNPKVSKNQKMEISITTSTILRIVLVLVLVYMAFYFRNLLLLVLTSVVIASALEPIVQKLEKYRFPRTLATTATYAGVIGIFVALIALIVPVFVVETRDLAENIPQYLETAEGLANTFLSSTGFEAEIESSLPAPSDLGSVSNELQGLANVFFNGARGALAFVFGSLFNFFFVFIIAFYLSVQKYGIDNFMKLVIPVSKQAYALNLWHRSQRKIGLWMGGQLLDGAIVAIMSFIGLTFLGVEYAFLLALIALFGSLIPLIGPVISVIPAALIGLSSGGVTLALSVMVLYFVIQQIESNFIYPKVIKSVVGVPSLVVIIAVVMGGTLFGFLGIVLSVPVSAAVMEYVRDIQKRNYETEKKLEVAAAVLAEEEKQKQEMRAEVEEEIKREKEDKADEGAQKEKSESLGKK